MSIKSKIEPQNPLILRCHRLMDAFTKSDDERDFYLDRLEGFIIYVDLDKPQEDIIALEKELESNPDRYCVIPKLTFYETKKIMEGFVNEKVYDIDTKEKLLDIIQSKEAREHFLEFIYDHHSELEKWQQYYQERSRIRIIEWLRNNHFHFVFEEDLEFNRSLLEKLKRSHFQTKVGKDILIARKTLSAKAKTYYSNEALNPRPKRGRPPKQAIKTEIEPQITTDIYTTVPPAIQPFLYIPDISASSITFSSKFDTEESLLARRSHGIDDEFNVDSLNQKLATLRSLSNRWIDSEKVNLVKPEKEKISLDDFEDEDEDEDWSEKKSSAKKSKSTVKTQPKKKKPVAKSTSTKKEKKVLTKPAKKPEKVKLSKKSTPAKVKLITSDNNGSKVKPKQKLNIKPKPKK